MKLSLGFSPCPNDTFIFDALVNKKIDTRGFDFDVVLEDVETLNEWAMQGKLDITKLSFPAFFRSMDNYVLLNSGSALGLGVGPLLITREQIGLKEITDASIAIPGENTTANLLLSFAFPNALKRVPTLFSEIEDSVISGRTRLGVIIHENRFTYLSRGLIKVVDLGAFWEQTMLVPIPLGGIAIRRSFDTEVKQQVDDLIRASLIYAYNNYPDLPPFVHEHAQSMDEEVMRQHIELYVNDYSIDLGDRGKKAIEKLHSIYSSMHAMEPETHLSENTFVS